MDMKIFSKLSKLFPPGQDFAHTLYTYRSVSRPIPMNANTLGIPSTCTDQQKQEIIDRNDDNNERIIDVLRPEIAKLKEFMVFSGGLVLNFKNAIEYLSSPEMRDKSIPEEIYRTMICALTLLITLDYMKDMKTCFKNDFQRYKQAINMRSEKLSILENSDIVEEMAQMQIFLSHPDPRKAKHFIFLTLQDEMKNIPGHKQVLIDLVAYCLRCIEGSMFLRPHEENTLLLSIPYLMILIDGKIDDYHAINVFQHNNLDLNRIKSLLLKHPVIPVFHEISINVLNVLERSTHFDRISMSNDWGGTLPDTTLAFHNISAQWLRIKEDHAVFTPKLITLLHNVENFTFSKSLDPLAIDRARVIYDVTRQGLKLLSSWNNAILRAMSWKYSHPAPVEYLQEMKADFTKPQFEYEKVVRYNFTKAELSMLIDVVGMIKSVAGMLDEAKANFYPNIRLHIHHEIQQMVQGTLLPIMHRLDKRKKDSFTKVFRLRQLIADWVDDEEPIQDYKAYSRKMGTISANHPARVVGADYVQLQHMRWNIWNLIHDYSSTKKVSGKFMNIMKNDMEPLDIESCERFYKESFFYPYMIDFNSNLRDMCDLSYMWYREVYLENTRCVQFPVEASIPYMLVERALSSKSEMSPHIVHNDYSLPLIDCIFYVLDIYNDAAYQALHFSKQQHLYDELEAELNLVFDHMIITISTDIFSHYKNLAGYTKLEKDFKGHLSMHGMLDMNLNKRLYEIPVSQRCIDLLGRTIDLNFIIKQQLNNLIFYDIELAFTKLDSVGITGLLEFATVMSVIEDTHLNLSEQFMLDPFCSLFKEHNETYDPKASRGFLNSFLVKNITENLLPNFNYNIFIGRFLKSQIIVKPFMQSTAQILHTRDHFGFGVVCGKAYHVCLRMADAQFSKDHLEAFIKVAGTYLDIPFVFDECVTFCWNSMIELLDLFVTLREDIPNVLLESMQGTSEEVFTNLFRQFQEVLLFGDLKSRLFQAYKEIGNAFAFMHMLNDHWIVTDHNNFMASAPLLAVCPSTEVIKLDMRAYTDGENVMDVDALSKLAPLGKSIYEIALSAEENLNLTRDSVTINNVPELNFRLANSMSKNTRGIYLLHVFIKSLGSCLNEIHFEEKWSVTFDNGAGVKDLTSHFHHQWSMLNFIYLSDDVSKHTPADIIDEETGLQVRNEDEFGHGFSIAGCLFLHLLGQNNQFQVLDCNRLIKKLIDVEQKTPSLNLDSDDTLRKTTDNSDFSLAIEKCRYLKNLETDMKVQDFIFGVLQSCCPHAHFNSGHVNTLLPNRKFFDEFI